MAHAKHISMTAKKPNVNWRAHIIGASLGLMALAASIAFPGQRSPIQLCLMTVIVGYLAIGDVWRLWRKPGFLRGLAISAAVHAAVLVVLWKSLPVHILTLVMIAGVEGIVLLLIMYKSLDIRE
jgi:hypothetical protein